MPDASERMGLRGEQRLAALQRDAALARVGRARRWLIAATAALTAAIAALVYAVTPGRSAAATHVYSSATAASSRSSGLQMPPPAGAGQLGLQGAAQAPTAAPPQPTAPAPGPVAGGGAVSGGS